MPPDIDKGGTADDRKWTVMVFMGADTIAGNASLIDFAEADLAEMRFVGSRDRLNIFVQVHRGIDVAPRRGRVTESMPEGIDALEIVPPDEADPARGHALECFIRHALRTFGRRVRGSCRAVVGDVTSQVPRSRVLVRVGVRRGTCAGD